MISFTLVCHKGHHFEGWFASGNAYEEQQAARMIACPDCGSVNISKGLMAPMVAGKDSQRRSSSASDVSDADATQAALHTAVLTPPHFRHMVRTLRRHVEQNFDNVDKNFAEEARRIHYGESKKRGIYGQTSAEEAHSLSEEGIETVQLPDIPTDDA